MFLFSVAAFHKINPCSNNYLSVLPICTECCFLSQCMRACAFVSECVLVCVRVCVSGSVCLSMVCVDLFIPLSVTVTCWLMRLSVSV